jgi:hypothetical protein
MAWHTHIHTHTRRHPSHTHTYTRRPPPQHTIYTGGGPCHLWPMPGFFNEKRGHEAGFSHFFSSLSRLHDHTQTRHTRYDSSGRVISPTQRPLPDNTQHSQQTNIHVPSTIRTRNPSKRAAADQRLRLRDTGIGPQCPH